MLGRAIVWPNVQLDDLLCANNDSYHREREREREAMHIVWRRYAGHGKRSVQLARHQKR
eukprot:COSAG03_NODE_29102_length_190_cov_21.340659_1_plen_58_part_01